MSELDNAREYWRTHHFQSARVPSRDEQPHRYTVCEFIAGLKPERVLEFGCSSGRNLVILRGYLPSAYLVGIDINPTTVAAGRDANPTIEYRLGDESKLADIPDKSFDVAFCVSVLDHVPSDHWIDVYDELSRVALNLVLLEPIKRGTDNLWLDADCKDLGIHAAEFSYLHNYLDYDPRLRYVKPVPIPTEHWPEFGSLYALLHRPPE